MKRVLVSGAFELLSHFPAVRRATARLWPRAVILVYHRVGESCFDPYGQLVSPRHFQNQMAYLRGTYHVESLATLVEQLSMPTWPDGTVVVTFDDGYVDNVHFAYPIAAAYNIPLTVFVIADPIRTGTHFWWDEVAWLVQREPRALATLEASLSDMPKMGGTVSPLQRFGNVHKRLRALPEEERLAILQWVRSRLESEPPSNEARPMTVGELRHFDALPGVTIGAHTMTHPVLSELSISEQRCELATSKHWLEAVLDHPVNLLAYPYGKLSDFSDASADNARAVGFHAACTTLPMLVVPTLSCFMLPRMTVHDWHEDEFAYRLAALFGTATG